MHLIFLDPIINLKPILKTKVLRKISQHICITASVKPSQKGTAK